jgi:hypothetical protein
LYPCGHSQVAEVVARILGMIVPVEPVTRAASVCGFRGDSPAARK